MEKLDLTKRYKSYYTATQKPQLVDITPAQFISITGKGDPSEKPFTDRIEALYSVAYAIKFAYKLRDWDFTVAKLEGLWWYDEERFAGKSMTEAATAVPRSEWEYRLMIRMPEYVERTEIHKAIELVLFKKEIQLVQHVEHFTMNEGKCVQMMHVGPYATEPETLQQMMAFMDEHKFGRNGLHHEIYLSDFRKTEPAKLRTILREPVQ